MNENVNKATSKSAVFFFSVENVLMDSTIRLVHKLWKGKIDRQTFAAYMKKKKKRKEKASGHLRGGESQPGEQPCAL